MNNKIPFHELAAKVAAVTGISPESAGNFIKNFFEIISDSLIKGETVKIKGLGTFAVTETDGEKTVKFDLDKELSESVNAPFSIFEPVTLNDQVTDKMLSDVDVEVDNEKHSDESAEEVTEIDTNDETASLEISETAELEQAPSEPEIKEIIAEEDTTLEVTTSQTSTSSVTLLRKSLRKYRQASPNPSKLLPRTKKPKHYPRTLLKKPPKRMISRKQPLSLPSRRLS